VCKAVVADFGDMMSYKNANAKDYRTGRHVKQVLEDACSTMGSRHPKDEVREALPAAACV
jgi:hypothetical protein